MHAKRRIHKRGLTDVGAIRINNAKSIYGQADVGAKSITSVDHGHCGGKAADAPSMHASLKAKQKKCAYCKVKQKKGEEFKSNPAMIQFCPSWIRIDLYDVLCPYCDHAIADTHLGRR